MGNWEATCGVDTLPGGLGARVEGTRVSEMFLDADCLSALLSVFSRTSKNNQPDPSPPTAFVPVRASAHALLGELSGKLPA